MSNSQRRSTSTKRRRILDELAEIQISAVNSVESECLQPLRETRDVINPVVQEPDKFHEGTI